MTTHERYDELVAAYALDLLAAEERRDFESHLSSCTDCQSAVADLRRVSASLGQAVEPVAPPPSLRARTMARATAMPQPLSGDSVRVAAPVAVPAVRQSAWWRPLATAAALVCIAGLGLYALSLRTQLDSTRGMLSEALERVDSLRREVTDAHRELAALGNTMNVVRSGDVIRVDLRGVDRAPAASGRALISLTRGFVFGAERLPGLPSNRSYQLWVVPDGAGAVPISAGVFSVDQSGNSSFSSALPAGVTSVVAVAVTEEPAGGSMQATTLPLLLGRAVNN